jgi:ADP-ribosyl-[dinitrogen reductase] hydrolase
MLGAIIGDIVGSVYEWDNYKAKDFQPLFHPKAFFTDDTVCTVAVADALLNGKDPALTLKDWGRRYWDNGGWGGRFALWLQSEDISPYGSFGNGAAMRVSAAGHIAGTPEEAIDLSRRVTEVTHNHPEGLRGGAATAVAIHLALRNHPAEAIREEVTRRFGYDLSMTVDEIRPGYRFNETCQGTVPQALVCALEARSYEGAIRNAISIGGDSDTVGAIAGGVAEALFGLPKEVAVKGWNYLPEDMRAVVSLLYERCPIRVG